MGAKSKIEWTERTWNPVVGCSVVSPGCTNCYAMAMAHRVQAMAPRAMFSDLPVREINHYDDTTKIVNSKPVWTGKVALAPDHIVNLPLHRHKPTMWFVNSMSDLFHEAIPDAWILRVLDVIRRTSWGGGSNCGRIANGGGEHTYQVLTKRSRRMRDFMRQLRFNQDMPLDECALYLADDNRPPIVLKNLWLGVSAERQQEADQRIPDLLATPAAVRFVSAEPLLGPIDLRAIWAHCPTHDFPGGFCIGPCPDRRRVDWVIVGGESGRGARPMHPAWARELRDQCTAVDVAFFFKQWGQWHADALLFTDMQGRNPPPNMKIGKAKAGRLLDGREWNEMPRAALKQEAA